MELDFSEEDVEFADRSELRRIAGNIDELLTRLCRSFSLGNVIKNGVPVAIVGNTNVGKSTLLNALLREDRAIVSDIAGTTRDVIEDTINLNGTLSVLSIRPVYGPPRMRSKISGSKGLLLKSVRLVSSCY